MRPHWSDVKGKVEQEPEMFEAPPGWTMCGNWYVQERRYVCMHFICMYQLSMCILKGLSTVAHQSVDTICEDGPDMPLTQLIIIIIIIIIINNSA